MSIDRRDMMIAGAAAMFGAGGMGFALTVGGRTGGVREYLMAHPEVISEAMAAKQSREIKKLVDANRARLETPFAQAWAGAADGDVTLVEFFDYNCSYCRAALPDIDRLLAGDKKLKIVYRELPILSEASDKIARASLAAAQLAGDYMRIHRMLYALARSDAKTIDAALIAAGVDPAKADPDMIATEIASNLDLQRQLQLSGTPSWVVGDTIINGAVGYDVLKKAIDETRTKRG